MWVIKKKMSSGVAASKMYQKHYLHSHYNVITSFAVFRFRAFPHESSHVVAVNIAPVNQLAWLGSASAPTARPHLCLFQELVWIRFLQINGDLGPHRLRYRCQY